MNKYNVGDTVYFIANGYHIREATVIRAGFWLLHDKIQRQRNSSRNQSQRI